MKGGGRFQRPMTTGSAGGVVARASVNPSWVENPDAGYFYARKPKRRKFRKSVTSSGHSLPRFLGTGLLALYFSGIAAFGFWQSGDFGRYLDENGALYNVAARAVGLGINKVTINGVTRLRVAEILDAAGVSPQGSLLFLNVTDMRDRLEQMPLVKSAAVRKLYPDELIITLAERQPFAVWQRKGELAIVAEDGTVIDHTVDARFASLPLVVGEDANLHIKQYLDLLEAAGPLKGRIRAGTFVAGRRWTFKMDNGIDVRLPETGTMDALKRLVSLERTERVLEKDVLAVDLRIADRVVCLVAELRPTDGLESLKGRTHLARIIGIGHQCSYGIKSGAVVDLDAAETAIRQAVHAAERMAKVEIQSVIVNTSGGRVGSQHYEAEVAVRHPVSNKDLYRVLEAANRHDPRAGRVPLHALPTGFMLDGQRNIVDPTGMIGEHLGVDLHVVTAEGAATRNLMLAVERCHLDVEAVIATPYASGLSALVDDEADMGCAVIDLGAGTTSTSVFSGGYLVHADVIAVGAHHITMDIARGLSTRVAAAERIKTVYGATIATSADDRDLIAVPQVDEDERDIPNHVPKSHLVRIIRPRVEEILELVRDRLRASGFLGIASRRIVLTGGGSQLVGLPDLARQVFGGQVRIGRPLGIKGLPEAAKGPAFSAAVGLLVYPQVAHIEYFEPRSSGFFKGTGTDGYFARVGRWLRDSF